MWPTRPRVASGLLFPSVEGTAWPSMTGEERTGGGREVTQPSRVLNDREGMVLVEVQA